MSVALDICVCTFRRDSLAATLHSLLAQELPDGIQAGILVVDNDDSPSAEDSVITIAARAALPVRYIHAPGRNIALARNAALDASAAPLIAFIDDDETATPGWIAALLAARAATEADIILGPVAARYPPHAPRWMQRAEIHATRPVWVAGAIRTGYSCNVLIDRTDPAIARARFDPVFGRTGGEDSMYFRALTSAGARIAYAPDALVEEPVAPERLSFGWLARRRIRMGQTHANSLMTHEGKSRIPAMALAAGKAAVCAGLALLTLPYPSRSMREALRACLHAGVVMGLAGRAADELYGQFPAGEIR